MIDSIKDLVVKLSPEINRTILEYIMPSHQQLSQTAFDDIMKLKEYTNSELNWFKKRFISKELLAALQNFNATQPKSENAKAQAAAVYSEFFRSTRFLISPLNWIGKLFLSGFRRFGNSPTTKTEEENNKPIAPLASPATPVTNNQLFNLQYNPTSAQEVLKNSENKVRDDVRVEQRNAWETLLESTPKDLQKTNNLDVQSPVESKNETIAKAPLPQQEEIQPMDITSSLAKPTPDDKKLQGVLLDRVGTDLFNQVELLVRPATTNSPAEQETDRTKASIKMASDLADCDREIKLIIASVQLADLNEEIDSFAASLKI